VLKNARDFTGLVQAVREKEKNFEYRGAVLCREHLDHGNVSFKPFARSLQQALLEEGHVMLSIPDDPDTVEDDGEEAELSPSSTETR
jgi:hypothetical protein